MGGIILQHIFPTNGLCRCADALGLRLNLQSFPVEQHDALAIHAHQPYVGKGAQRASYHVSHCAQVCGDLILRPSPRNATFIGGSTEVSRGMLKQKACQPSPHRAQR